jgi:hypothetical protein
VLHLTPAQFWAISPREFALMAEGRQDELDRQRRFAARWTAPLLSALAGQVVTEADLLGEADPVADQARKIKLAQKRLEKTMKQLAQVNPQS